MRFAKTLLSLPLAALALLAHTTDASACGACVVQQGENTIVTGHRMILSVSPQETTLWDQISYQGEPESFAWVLPVQGVVEVGLSSDALFQTLETLTQVYVSSPVINCPPPPSCDGTATDGAPNAGGGAGSGTGGDPVQVLAQETVGPYETVQLASDDPAALQNWLQSHGYVLPLDLQPVVSSYVDAGFNFLALKLVPGQGVNAMRPVRVSWPGAGATLPLRMVAGGTGAITPISLWIMGEGRYEPTNFPSFQIDPEQLVWNWDEQRSNYAELKSTGFEVTDGAGWLLEAGEPMSKYNLEYPLKDLVSYNVTESGYGDPATGDGAMDELNEDLFKLYAGIPDSSLWVSRMSGELTRAALADDLDLGAALDQQTVTRYFEATKTTGSAPECPSFPGCGDTGEGEDPGGAMDVESDDIWGGSGSCAIGRAGGAPAMLGGLVLGVALALARRRQARRAERR